MMTVCCMYVHMLLYVYVSTLLALLAAKIHAHICTYMHIHITYMHIYFGYMQKYMQDKTVHLLYMYINVYACICMHLVYIQCSISMYLKYYVYTCLYKFQVSSCTMSGLKRCITCILICLPCSCSSVQQRCNTAVQQQIQSNTCRYIQTPFAA